MIVVGCDFGLVKSGIVVLDQGGEILSQTLIRVQSKGAQRLVDIESGFDQIIRPYEDITIFVEGYAYGAKYQRESLAELGGVMRRYFCLNNLDFWVIPPRSLKFYVTGAGKATKNYMKKCTKERWGVPFKSDDVCDAYGLARLGLGVVHLVNDLPYDLNDHELDITSDIVNNKDYYLNGNTAKRLIRKNKK